MEDIGDFISQQTVKLRNQLNLTQSQLAEKADLSLRGIQGIEYRKTKDPSITTVVKLAKIFSVNLDEFVFGRPVPSGRTVAEMGIDELKSEIAAVSKRDDLETVRLKKRIEELEAKLSSLPGYFWPYWEKAGPRLKHGFLYLVAGQPEDLKGLSAEFLKILKKMKMELTARR